MKKTLDKGRNMTNPSRDGLIPRLSAMVLAARHQYRNSPQPNAHGCDGESGRELRNV